MNNCLCVKNPSPESGLEGYHKGEIYEFELYHRPGSHLYLIYMWPKGESQPATKRVFNKYFRIVK